MNLVCNIRGTSGSGKSTIIRNIMAKGIVTPLEGTAKKPDGYRIDRNHDQGDGVDIKTPIYVVGPYVTTCGGTDAVSTQDEICNRIRQYAPQGHVLVEGLLMSHLFSRYAMLDRELHVQGIGFIWAFLDTPIDVCLARVRARREAKGNLSPLNETNTRDKHRDMFSVYDKATKERERDWKKVLNYKIAKLDARWVPYLTATEEIFSWLT